MAASLKKNIIQALIGIVLLIFVSIYLSRHDQERVALFQGFAQIGTNISLRTQTKFVEIVYPNKMLFFREKVQMIRSIDILHHKIATYCDLPDGVAALEDARDTLAAVPLKELSTGNIKDAENVFWRVDQLRQNECPQTNTNISFASGDRIRARE